MRISGTAPSPVILSQTKYLQKLKSDTPKMSNQAKAKWTYTENFDDLKRYESTKVDRRSWLHVPSGTPWSTSSDTHQVVEI